MGSWGAKSAAGRIIVLDNTKPDNVWSSVVTRGESILIRADLYSRGAVYTNNDLRGFLWIASNHTDTAGLQFLSTTQETGSIWFEATAAKTLGLSTNAETVVAECVLTNTAGTRMYDWGPRGILTFRAGGGIGGTGAASLTSVVNWDTITSVGSLPWTNLTVSVTNISVTGGLLTSSGTSMGLTTAAVRTAAADITNGLDTVTARAAAVAASTQTIAAASLSGTIDNARLSGVTTNNASQIDSGTLADARIAATIARDSEVSIATNAAIDDATGRVAAVGYLLPASTSALATASSVVAATGTIAGASVSGTVPAATWALTSATSTTLVSGASVNGLNNSGAITNLSRVVQTNEAVVFLRSTTDNIGLEGDSWPISGQQNSVWLGVMAAYASTGQWNTAIGYSALNQTLGSYNTAIGRYTLNISPGSFNTAVGNECMDESPGSYNMALGYLALQTSAGSYNTALGAGCLSASPGSYNVSGGTYSLSEAPGSNNVAFGFCAGQRVGGTSNVFIGSEAGYVGEKTNYINTTVIGAGVVSKGNNTTVIGLPTSAVSIDGSLTILGGGNVVTNGQTGVTLTGTLTPTNALTVTNSLQLGGIAAANYPTNAGAAGAGYFAQSNGQWVAFSPGTGGGGGADLNSTNYFRNAANLTNLTAAGIWTNAGASAIMYKTTNQTVASDGAGYTVIWDAYTNASDLVGVNALSMGNLTNGRFTFSSAGVGLYLVSVSVIVGATDPIAIGKSAGINVRHFCASEGTTNLLTRDVVFASVAYSPILSRTVIANVRSTNDWIDIQVDQNDNDAGVESIYSDTRTRFSCTKLQ